MGCTDAWQSAQSLALPALGVGAMLPAVPPDDLREPAGRVMA
ncbi:hypothetical protein AB0C34_26055 [Nocardia sp. NPDC049220]